MNNGWIKIHRKIRDNCIYKDSHLLHLFIHCLLKANHKINTFLFNKQEITIERGQFVTGRLELAKELNMNSSLVYRKLKILENIGIVNIKTNNKFSIVTVLKYNTYQDVITTSEQQNEQQVNNKRTTSEQQVNTNKNNKKENNEKNTVEFERFWSLYNKKRGNKERIYKHWCLLKDQEHDKIFATLPEYIKNTPDKKFRKDPQTYLNQKAWNDEIIPISTNGIYKPKDLEPEKF